MRAANSALLIVSLLKISNMAMNEDEFIRRVEDIRIKYSPALVIGWIYTPHEEKFKERMDAMNKEILDLNSELDDEIIEREFNDATQRILDYVKAHNENKNSN